MDVDSAGGLTNAEGHDMGGKVCSREGKCPNIFDHMIYPCLCLSTFVTKGDINALYSRFLHLHSHPNEDKRGGCSSTGGHLRAVPKSQSIPKDFNVKMSNNANIVHF